MALQALDVTSSGRTMALQIGGWRASPPSWAQERRRVHNIAGSGRAMLLQAREWHHRLRDEACVVDGATSLGWQRWQCVRLRPWSGTMVQRLQGGLNDGMEAPGRT
jgi:hypothetical protein